MKFNLLTWFSLKWNAIFQKHPIIEALILSVLIHILLFILMICLCEIIANIIPYKPSEKVIEIEFIK